MKNKKGIEWKLGWEPDTAIHRLCLIPKILECFEVNTLISFSGHKLIEPIYY